MPLIYGFAALVKSNGFLAVYVAGIVIGNSSFVQKRSLLRFHDGLAWLMQIVMFLVLGLQVFPSHLIPVIPVGLLVAAFLMFVARPVSVFLGLSLSKLSLQEKGLISWVGLRGAAPIVLATFPLLAGVAKADMIFNLVFFIVLTSALLQGSTIPLVARWLSLEAAAGGQKGNPSTGPIISESGVLHLISVSPESAAAGKQLVDLCLPGGVLIVYIQRGAELIVPGGSTIVNAGDQLHLLVSEVSLTEIVQQLASGNCDKKNNG